MKLAEKHHSTRDDAVMKKLISPMRCSLFGPSGSKRALNGNAFV